MQQKTTRIGYKIAILTVFMASALFVQPTQSHAAASRSPGCGSWIYTLDFTWTASVNVLDGIGTDVSVLQIGGTIFTRHLCFCTTPGSMEGDCFYDSAGSSDPDPPHHADAGCGWDDRDPGPDNCVCTWPLSSCCGDIINP